MPNSSITTLSLTTRAAGAVTARRAVGFDGAQATVQGQKILGIAHTDAADGDSLALDVRGTAVVEAGAAINVGDSLIVDAQGRAIPTTGNLAVAAGATAVTSTAANGEILTGGDLPEFIFADALESAAAAGEFIEVLLR